MVKAAKLPGWPADPVSLPCDHAGLLLLFPAMAELGLPRLVRAAGYPSTRQLSSWQSVGSLLLAKCARKARIRHAGSLSDDSGFHLDALTSGVPLNVDLDTTLTVVAGNLYRLLALKLDRYEQATPDKIWRDFLDAAGTLHIGPGGVTCALNLRSHHPVLIDAGFAELQVPDPLVARPQPALPVPATLTSRPGQPQLITAPGIEANSPAASAHVEAALHHMLHSRQAVTFRGLPSGVNTSEGSPGDELLS